MTCILRIHADGSPIGALVPYRFENGIAHFQVSDAEFSNIDDQVQDATNFLQKNDAVLLTAVSQPGANGVLDFAVEWRDVAVQVETFPAELVRWAGKIGLALQFSHYPSSEASNED
jgi:hypothetical protein